MVYLVAETRYPANKAGEVGKKYLEVMKKYPQDKSISKPIIPSAIWVTHEGIHGLVVYSIMPGKVKEAMDMANNRLLMLSTIEGVRYDVRIAYELAEALPLIGLSAPKE
jgi:hypothetical protein